MKKIVVSLLFVLYGILLYSQEYHWELKYIGLGWHPQDESANAEYLPLKLDDDGTFMLNVGLMTSFERYFKKNGYFSLEMMGALYLDCGMLPNSVAHFGFRGNLINTERINLNAGFGPTILIRRNWSSKIPDYESSGYFNGGPNDRYQWKTYWYGGEIELNYKINTYNHFSVSLVPGFPKYVVLFFGFERTIKYFGSKEREVKRKRD